MTTSIDTINYVATSGQNDLIVAIKQNISSKNSAQHAVNRILSELVDLYGDDTKKVYDNFALRLVEVYATLGADYSTCEHFTSNLSTQVKRSVAKILKRDCKVETIYQMPKMSAKGVKTPKFSPQHTLAIGDFVTRWIIGVNITDSVKKPEKDVVTDSVPVFSFSSHSEQFKQIGDLADTVETIGEKLKDSKLLAHHAQAVMLQREYEMVALRIEVYALREKRRESVLKLREQSREMRALKRERDALIAANAMPVRKSTRKPKVSV
jgi:hypothetical protein